MKRFIFLFFGMIVVAISAVGQGPLKADDKLLQWKLHLPAPSGVQLNGHFPLPDTARAMVATQRGSIRVRQPDHMSCVAPDLARVERIPTLRSANKDPMLNGFRLPK